MRKYGVAATITISRAADMAPQGRKQIASWLHQHAKDLVKWGYGYSPRFTGHYYYRETNRGQRKRSAAA